MSRSPPNVRTSSGSCRGSSSPAQAVDEAFRLADQIVANAPLAVWASRKVVLASAYADDEVLKRMTNDEFATVVASADTKEGLTAFIEKRPPKWTGQ